MGDARGSSGSQKFRQARDPFTLEMINTDSQGRHATISCGFEAAMR